MVNVLVAEPLIHTVARCGLWAPSCCLFCLQRPLNLAVDWGVPEGLKYSEYSVFVLSCQISGVQRLVLHGIWHLCWSGFTPCRSTRVPLPLSMQMWGDG